MCSLNNDKCIHGMVYGTSENKTFLRKIQMRHSTCVQFDLNLALGQLHMCPLSNHQLHALARLHENEKKDLRLNGHRTFYKQKLQLAA